MSSPALSSFHFPDVPTMVDYLSHHPLLAIPYFVKNGITKAIAELTAERLNNYGWQINHCYCCRGQGAEKTLRCGGQSAERTLRMTAKLIVTDLQTGKDNRTDEEIAKVNFPLSTETVLYLVNKALLDCAKAYSISARAAGSSQSQRALG